MTATVVKVALTSGMAALIDESDWPLVEPLAWSAQRSRQGQLWYACAWLHVGRRVLMHNLITGWRQVDHINGDGLDNQRSNLRPASHRQNMGNRRKGQTGSSKYKGVYWQKSRRRWKAQIGINGNRVYLGLFDDEEPAAHAYDEAARTAFGEFAALNFPRAGEVPCHR